MAETPARDKPTESFLSAEEAAKKLVAALESLKKETEGYAAAERSLKESGERITQLAARLEELSQRSVEALDVVRSVGGPQIVEELRSIAPTLDGQSKTLTQQAEIAAALVPKMAELGEMSASANSELTSIRGEQAQIAQALGEAVRSAQSRIQLLMGGVAFLTVIVLILVIVLIAR